MNKPIMIQVQEYLGGTRAECPHPENRVIPVGNWKDVCCVCGQTVFAVPFHEIPKNGTKRAGKKVRARMWARLWGNWTPEDVRAMYDITGGEVLDLTQI